MKKLSILLVVCFLFGFQQTHARTFKIATLAPDGTNWMKEIRKGAKNVAKLTDNRVKFKFYTGGVMGSERTVLKKMRVGQLQGGAFTATALTDIYQDAQIYNLPFLFRSHAEVDYIRSKMDDAYKKGMAENGLVILGMSHGGFAYFMSDTPIRTVDDVRNKKVWLPEGAKIIETVYKVSHITPIPLSMANVYTGLQTGMIDSIGSNPMGAIAFQWHTKIKYVTDIPLFYLIGIVAVDKKAFNKLDKKDQTIVLTEMGKIMDKLGEINRHDNTAARAALEKHGIKFVSLNIQEHKRWQEIATQATEALGKEGAYSIKMYNTLQQHLQDFRKINPTDTTNDQ